MHALAWLYRLKAVGSVKPAKTSETRRGQAEEANADQQAEDLRKEHNRRLSTILHMTRLILASSLIALYSLLTMTKKLDSALHANSSYFPEWKY